MNEIVVKSNDELTSLAGSIEAGKGLLVDCSEKTYHRDTTYWSKSKIWAYHQSPKTFAGIYIFKSMKPNPPSTKMDAGSIFHSILLEAKPWKTVIAVYPKSCLKSNGVINHKPAKAFKEEAYSKGMYPLKEKDVPAILNAIKSVRMNPHIGQWLELAQEKGNIEKTFLWKCPSSGLLCKSRVDFFVETILFDLKFSGMWRSSKFKFQSKDFGYWFQDTHYSAGFEAVFDQYPEFNFICVNDSMPHQNAVNFHDQDTRHRIPDHYQQTMMSLADSLQRYENDPEDETIWLDPDETELNPIYLHDRDLSRGAA